MRDAGVRGSGGHPEVPGYFGLVNGIRHKAGDQTVRLTGRRPALLSDIWQRGWHGIVAGTEQVFAAGELGCCGRFRYPTFVAAGKNLRPTNDD
jgi:hypothetical protein